ncbi:4Fe-4S dicluster domain-containing protein [Desulfobaculum senezii]
MEKTIRFTDESDRTFIQDVREASGQDLALCYQCGKCAAGCPAASASDVPVSQILRLVQAGQRKAVLSARSLWLCATCETCSTRCPNGIDVALVMDVLRHMARREGFASERNVKLFHDSFLRSIFRHGRVYEMGLMAEYNLRSGRPFTGADLAHRILPKGKLSLRPHDIAGKAEVAAIAKRWLERRKKEGGHAL